MRNVAAKRLAARWAVNGLSSNAFGFLPVSTSGSFHCIDDIGAENVLLQNVVGSNDFSRLCQPYV
jgi:hypothetical protein